MAGNHYPAPARLFFSCLAVLMIPAFIVELAGFPKLARLLFTTVIVIAVVTLLCCAFASGSYGHEEE